MSFLVRFGPAPACAGTCTPSPLGCQTSLSQHIPGYQCDVVTVQLLSVMRDGGHCPLSIFKNRQPTLSIITVLGPLGRSEA